MQSLEEKRFLWEHLGSGASSAESKCWRVFEASAHDDELFLRIASCLFDALMALRVPANLPVLEAGFLRCAIVCAGEEEYERALALENPYEMRDWDLSERDTLMFLLDDPHGAVLTGRLDILQSRQWWRLTNLSISTADSGLAPERSWEWAFSLAAWKYRWDPKWTSWIEHKHGLYSRVSIDLISRHLISRGFYEQGEHFQIEDDVLYATLIRQESIRLADVDAEMARLMQRLIDVDP